MTITVFFSWQSDTSSREGRDLIEKALEAAAKRMSQDITIEEAARDLRIDKDTKNIPGQPAVVDTIFKKISDAALFVPDLTFIGTRRDGRPTPNPNVMIEYGWALKALGNERIVPVMNTAHGMPTEQSMPFDMRHLRHPRVLYDCADGVSDELLAQHLEELTGQFEQEIHLVLASVAFKKSLPKLPPFRAAQAKNGEGKFRASGEPLGINHSLAFLGRDNVFDVILEKGPAMWLRLMPVTDVGEILITELGELMRQGGLVATLLGRPGGYSYVRGEDGVGLYEGSGQEGITTGLIYVFTTGEIWTVDTYFLEQQRHFNAIPHLEANFINVFDRCAKFLREQLDIKPPYKWIAGMENLKGRGLNVPIEPGYSRISRDPLGACSMDTVIAEGEYTPGSITVKEALRPFFIKIYDKCGVQRPQFLDNEIA